MAKGYWNDSGRTAQRFRDGEVWSGDRAVVGADGLLRAQVRGSGVAVYDVAVELSDDPYGHEGFCTCPLGTFCKHIVATLLTWREQEIAARRGTATRAMSEPTITVRRSI